MVAGSARRHLSLFHNHQRASPPALSFPRLRFQSGALISVPYSAVNRSPGPSAVRRFARLQSPLITPRPVWLPNGRSKCPSSCAIAAPSTAETSRRFAVRQLLDSIVEEVRASSTTVAACQSDPD